jgi:hypothetical protein
MAKNKLNHKYLISLYTKVDDFLDKRNIAKEELPDSIVSFCIVAEKVLKIKLHSKNQFLVFEASNITENTIPIIALGGEENIPTAKIKDVIGRFGVVFKEIFTPDEFQALKDIYVVRSSFVHGYKSDDQIVFDAENIVSKMGTLWPKISEIAIYLFGKKRIKSGKPRKKYTEKELQEVLEDEVRKMIKPLSTSSWQSVTGLRFMSESANEFSPISYRTSAVVGAGFISGDRCPRCGSLSFSLDNSRTDWSRINLYAIMPGETFDSGSNLYKCKDCHLELTEKQYEIAKKILNTPSKL